MNKNQENFDPSGAGQPQNTPTEEDKNPDSDRSDGSKERQGEIGEDQKQNELEKLVASSGDIGNLISEAYYYGECCERYYLLLKAVLKCKINDWDADLSKVPNSMEELYEKLKEHLAIEGFDKKEKVAKLLKQADAELQANYKNLPEFEKVINRVVEETKILSINIPLLERLIEKSKRASALVEDKSIILLFGKTGAGKSTFTHFINGSKMKKVKSNSGVTYVAPTDIKNPQLQQVVVSYKPVSETLLITPITMNLKELINQNKQLTIVDTPGQEDNRSIEIDISNQLGVTYAIKVCKDIKPIVIFSKLEQGDKMESFKQYLHYLTEILLDINQIEHFTYFYSKYTKDEADNLKAKIEDLYNKESENSTIEDDPLIRILEDVRDKVEETSIIDPLKDDFKRILKNLLRNQPIKHADEVFQFHIGQKSKIAISQFVKETIQRIRNNLKKRNFSLISQQLFWIQKVRSIVEGDDNDYSHILDDIKDEINKSFESITMKLKHKVEIDCELLEVQTELQNFLDDCLKMKYADQIRDKFENGYPIPFQEYQLFFDQMIQQMTQRFLDENQSKLQQLKIFQKLETINRTIDQIENKQIRTIFGQENIIACIKQCRSHFHNQIIKLVFALKEDLEKRNLQKGDENLRELLLIRGVFSNSNLKSEILEIFEEVQTTLQSQIGKNQDNTFQIIQNIKQNFNPENLNDNIVIFQKLQEGSFSQFIEEINQTQRIIQILQQIETLLQEKYQGLVEENTELMEKSDFMNLKKNFEIQEKFKKIKGHEQYYVEQFQESIDKTCSEALQLKIVGEKELEKFQQDPEKANFGKIIKYLREIQKILWLENYKKNIHASIKQQFIDGIIEKLAEFSENLQRYEVDIENTQELLQNIKPIINLFTRAKELMTLSPELKDLILEVQKNFQIEVIQKLKKYLLGIDLQLKDFSKKAVANWLERIDKVVIFLDSYSKNIKVIDLSGEMVAKKQEENKVNQDECINEKEESKVDFNQEQKSKNIPDYEYYQAENLKEIIKEFLENYKQYLHNDMRTILEKIQNQLEDESDQYQDALKRQQSQVQFSKQVRQLKYIIKDIKSIQTKSQKQFEYIAKELELQVLQEEFIERYQEIKRIIDDDLENLSIYQNNPLKLDTKIYFLKSLRELDDVVTLENDKKFSSSYENINKELKQNQAEELKELEKVIQKGTYTKVKNILYELKKKKESSIGKINYSKAQDLLNQDIEDKLDKLNEIRNNILLNIESFEYKTLLELINQLKAFKQIAQNDQYLEEEELFQKSKDQIENGSKILDLVIDSIITKMNQYNSTLKFKEASELKQTYLKVQQLFDIYFEEQGGEKLKQAQKKLEKYEQDLEKQVKFLVDNYRKLKIEDVTKANSPQKLLKALGECSDVPFCQAAKQQIEQEMSQNIRNEVKNIIEQIFEEEQLKFKEKCIREKLEILPDEIGKEEIKSELEMVVKFQQDTIQGEYKDIQSLIQDQKFKELKSKFSQLQGSVKEKVISKEIEKQVGKKFDYGISQLNKVNIQENNFDGSEYLKELQKIVNIKNDFEYSQQDQQLQEQIEVISRQICDFFDKEKEFFDLKKFQIIEQYIQQDVQEQSETKLKISQKKQTFDFVFQVAEIGKKSHYIELEMLSQNTIKQTEEPNQEMKDMSQYQFYQELFLAIKAAFEQKCKALKEVQLVNQKTDFKQSYENLNQFFKDLNQQMVEFQYFQIISNFIPDYQKEQTQINQSFLTKIDDLATNNLGTLQKLSVKEGQLQNFQNAIDIFTSIEDYFGDEYQKKVKEYQKKFKEEVKIRIKKIQKPIFEDKVQEPKNVSYAMIELQKISMSLMNYDQKIEKKINKMIDQFKGKHKLLLEVAQDLKSSEVGNVIVGKYKKFDAQKTYLFQSKITQRELPYFMENIQGTDLEKSTLEKRYLEYYEHYQAVIFQYSSIISKGIQEQKNQGNKQYGVMDFLKPLKTLIRKCNGRVNDSKYNFSKLIGLNWLFEDKKNELQKFWVKQSNNFIQKLANIFAFWTLLNGATYFETYDNVTSEGDPLYLKKPHCGQVLTILRFFSIGDPTKKNQLANNAVQLGTGEGKSVVLAITACLLAIYGFQVDIACYSSCLTERDYESFIELFQALEVENMIHYKTLDKLCEDQISASFNFREDIDYIIRNNQFQTSNDQAQENLLRVLLVDEFDTFFSSDFYGETYDMSLKFKNQDVQNLIKTIRATQCYKLSQVKKLNEYQKIQTAYPQWIQLFDECIKDLQYDFQCQDQTCYKVIDNQICYKDKDDYVKNIDYGYQTQRLYFEQYESGEIKGEENLLNQIGFIIKCGSISYAELPNKYCLMFGVTGTLKQLNNWQQDIISKKYKINKFTYMPTCYKEKVSLDFENIKIQQKQTFFTTIIQEIERVRGQSQQIIRPIIIFFDELETLEEFENYEPFTTKFESECIQKLVETQRKKQRDQFISFAGSNGKITLATQAFGRGTDFIVTNQQINSNGGVHLIVTFFPETASDIIQIKGRTGRQGSEGSCQMILLDLELDKFQVNSNDLQNSGKELFQAIDKKREIFIEEKQKTLQDSAIGAQLKHEKSLKFINQFKQKEIQAVKNYLFQENIGVQQKEVEKIRTLIAIDATGSMSNLLRQTIQVIADMFEESFETFKSKNIDEDCIQIQIIVYRNYNTQENEIIESSGWKEKEQALSSWLRKVTCKGGWGNEAIELALQFINAQEEKIHQVFIIGDAPSNSEQDVSYKRANGFGEDYWIKTKYRVPTHYIKELKICQQNEILINTLYLENRAKVNFQEMAAYTKGKCNALDINNTKESATKLKELITDSIVYLVGESNGGKGEEFVEALREVRKTRSSAQ